MGSAGGGALSTADGRESICGVGKRIIWAAALPRKRAVPRRRGELRYLDTWRSRYFSVEISATAGGH